MVMSRRTFAQGVGATMLLNGGLARAYAAAPERLTAEQVVQRIMHFVTNEGISATEFVGCTRPGPRR